MDWGPRVCPRNQKERPDEGFRRLEKKRMKDTVYLVKRDALRAFGAVLLLFGIAPCSVAQGGNAWSPSVSVYSGTDLNFGQAGSGQGEVEIRKSSSSGGSFEIKAQLAGNQRIRIDISGVNTDERTMGGAIPYTLRAAYNETADSRSSATEMTGSTVELDPRANQVKAGPGPPHRSAFVYVYGTADVGNVGSGTYTDGITLHAEIVGGPGDDDDFDDDYDDDDEDDDDEDDDDDDDDDDGD